MADPFGFMILASVAIRPLEAETRIRLDSSLIRSWRRDASLPCPPPFRATYTDERTGRQFVFLGVNHLDGPTKPSEIPAVAAEINSFRPNQVVVEMDTEERSLPKNVIEDMGRDCMREGRFTCGEPAYAAVIASNVNASVLGGEVSFGIVGRELSRSRSREDLLAFASVRSIITLQREGVPESQWRTRFMADVKRSFSSFVVGDWSYEKFQAWLSKNMNSTPNQITDQWLEPRNDSGATIIQKISSEVSQIREPKILKAAENAINSGQKAMMIYGSGHYFTLAPALEKAFGKPQINCLSSQNPESNSTLPNSQISR